MFIFYLPKEIKALYLKHLEVCTVAGADLELPGIGEVFGMSQREDDYDTLLKAMQERNMKIEDYSWYLKLRKYGGVQTSGFGIGFERLLMYLTGIENIKDVTPYPRTVSNCEF